MKSVPTFTIHENLLRLLKTGWPEFFLPLNHTPSVPKGGIVELRTSTGGRSWFYVREIIAYPVDCLGTYYPGLMGIPPGNWHGLVESAGWQDIWREIYSPNGLPTPDSRESAVAFTVSEVPFVYRFDLDTYVLATFESEAIFGYCIVNRLGYDAPQKIRQNPNFKVFEFPKVEIISKQTGKDWGRILLEIVERAEFVYPVIFKKSGERWNVTPLGEIKW